ncbi:hypothetical protein [Helicobacter macacae]|nr:hypothetical protein [Helicobacter macacae]
MIGMDYNHLPFSSLRDYRFVKTYNPKVHQFVIASERSERGNL